MKEAKRKCFVIGPMNDLHIGHLHWLAKDVVAPILAEKGFKVFTPDVKEAGNIMHHVIRSADRAELVIADTTGNNPNVLYEIAVLDAMGRACVPVKLVDPDDQEEDKIPFDRAQYRIFKLQKGQTPGAVQDLRPVIENVLERQEDGDMQENPLTDFFGFPLSSLSSANGLARGYYRNFVQKAIQGTIIKGPDAFVGSKRLPLECVIPGSVDLATRSAVQDVEDAGHIVPVQLEAPGRIISAFVWSEEISPKPILVDIPTALGQLRDNILSRLGSSAKKDPESDDFLEIQADEIRQFTRYLDGFKNKDPEPQARKAFRIIPVEDSRFAKLFDQ